MHKILLKIHKYLYSQKKIKYLLFLFLGLVAVIFESFGYISIVPLITVLINPDYLHQSIILKYINSLFHTIHNRQEHETDVLCLCELVTIVGKYLKHNLKNSDNSETFEIIILKRLIMIKEDRATFKPKLRFLVMNVIDLYK